jgi:hypothetical protein
MSEEDFIHCTRRMREELEAARVSDDAEATEAHLALAYRYDEILRTYPPGLIRQNGW